MSVLILTTNEWIVVIVEYFITMVWRYILQSIIKSASTIPKRTRARFIKNAIQGQIRSMMNSTRQLIWIDIDCCWHLQVVAAAVVVVVVLEVAVVAAVLWGAVFLSIQFYSIVDISEMNKIGAITQFRLYCKVDNKHSHSIRTLVQFMISSR